MGMLLIGLPIVLILLLSLASGIVMIVGGVKMLRLESHGWSMAACIAAVLPLHALGVIGLVVGIWGLVVLNQPQVRQAFRQLPGPARAQTGGMTWLIVVAVAVAGLIVLVPASAVLVYWLMAM